MIQNGEQVKRHLLTVGLEDYYQVGSFNRLIQRGEWYRFENRLERGTRATLELLDEQGVTATFFTLGWVADQVPELLRLVADRGHEVASKGYYHRGIRQLSPGEFREDLARSREALERASGRRVIGFRLADHWFGPEDLWALNVLAEEGYEYDSSIGPILRRFAAEPWRRFTHTHQVGNRTLWEFPISSANVLGLLVPVAGGNYFRQFPDRLVRRAVDRWVRTYSAPFVMYFHTWEMDPDQPKITAASWLTRVRHYRNLDQMPRMLRYYLSRYRFTSVADYLGVSTYSAALAFRPAAPAIAEAETALAAPAEAKPEPQGAARLTQLPAVTIVVPCHNEELILPYLANTLRSVETRLGAAYDLHFLFVDDGSTDGTWDALQRLFGSKPNCASIRQQVNRGVAASILRGINQAQTEIVCSIDCDCTYDPHELANMIPLLGDAVDMVTASPYHPLGAVRKVPPWRVVLSRGASRLYALVLHQKLWTYTSCFRVYRRSAVAGIRLSRGGFLGVAELLGRLDLAGRRVVEYPATLEVRLLGRSKMRVLLAVKGHLAMLARLALLRLFGAAVTPAPASTQTATPAPREHAGV